MSATLRRSVAGSSGPSKAATPENAPEPPGPRAPGAVDAVTVGAGAVPRAHDDGSRRARVEHTIVPYLPWVVIVVGTALVLPFATRFFGALTVALGGLLLLIEHSVRYPTDVRHCCSVPALAGFHPSPVGGLAVEVRGRMVRSATGTELRAGSRSVPLAGLHRRGRGAGAAGTRDAEAGDLSAVRGIESADAQVVVTGWYRTVPSPVLEVRAVRRADGSVVRARRWQVGPFVAVAVAAAGLALAAATAL